MWMLDKILGMFSSDMAMDLGTANTLVYVSGKGIVLNEPSVIAMLHERGGVVPYAFGHDAKIMLGKTPPEIRVIRPLKDGVIADFQSAEEMVKHFIRSVHEEWKFFARPRVIVCVPYGSTPVERRAIQDAVESAGARDVWLIYEPMAAAIGAGLPVIDPIGCMIVDIGGGTTEISIISLGGIVENACISVRYGGDSFDEAILNYIRKEYNLLIGEATAEKIKKAVGNAHFTDKMKNHTMKVKGRDLTHGIPKEIDLSEKGVARSLKEPIQQIVDAVRKVLESSPPELSSDLVEHGIVLTGGGAMLRGMDEKLKAETVLPVTISDEPLMCVAKGTGKVLENFSELKHVLFKQD